ncbi:hypothetical protein [Paludibacter jiangxiensis]|uniref:Pilus formation protein N terminal region n=1 Tax=Paludibacter jiangxiensis TaxID=681398 RepID=A0A170YUV9_9BACT|nr:hypothetical protein [Paludibacter jiangxiensis]GAT62083.1 hypothetical protein PJIAN_1673 [Paludibacter jiangxiensis]
MIKKIFFLFLALVTIVSCSKNEDEQIGPLQVDKSSVVLSTDNPYAAIQIIKGSGSYSVSSSNESVAEYLLLENTLYISGNAIGNAVVTLSDGEGNSVKIKVEVKNYIARIVPLSTVVFLKKGDTKSIEVTKANAVFAIHSSGSNSIQVKESGNKVLISGLSLGAATLYYFEDFWPTQIYNVQIIEHYSFSISSSSTNISVTKGNDGELYIISGNGSYSLSTSASGVISTELRPYPIAATLSQNNPAVVYYKAIATGVTVLTVTDNETGESKSFSIRVN